MPSRGIRVSTPLEKISAFDQDRLRWLDQVPVEILGQLQREISALDQERLMWLDQVPVEITDATT